MKSIATVTSIAALCLTAACNNPADKAPPAKVSDQQAQAAAPAADDAKAVTQVLRIDPANTKLKFTGSKVTGSHDGSFEKFDGTVSLKGDKVESAVIKLAIEMASVQTEPEKLLGHLKSPDFFDVEKFPKSEFESTRIKSGGANGATHTVEGKLTLHGVTKTISFPATLQLTDDKLNAKSEFSINRKDFGIVYPGMPDDLIRDEVLIKLDVAAPRKTGA
ncbi:MAG TPA: YceI family protein [Polyangiaceae bacterium]|nr:YceI family protein [Polyangiaceae bacterium]